MHESQRANSDRQAGAVHAALGSDEARRVRAGWQDRHPILLLDVRRALLPAVFGKKGERFLYLKRGEVGAGGSFARFRRAKLMIGDIEPELLAAAARVDGVLVASLSLADERGGPRCARVKPPVISWRSG